MPSILIAVILACTQTADARTILIEKKVDPSQLIAKLKEGGIANSVLECPPGRMRCTLHLPDDERRSPQSIIDAYVYIDVEEARAKERNEMRGLVGKLKTTKLTQSERDRLLAWVAEQLLMK